MKSVVVVNEMSPTVAGICSVQLVALFLWFSLAGGIKSLGSDLEIKSLVPFHIILFVSCSGAEDVSSQLSVAKSDTCCQAFQP